MNTSVKIGKTQAAMLSALDRHGHWSRTAGWSWKNNSTTERLLESLVKRGLVEKFGLPLTRMNGSTFVVDAYRVVKH